MAKNLVIVESPAKAKTIEGYLGKDFKVLSSYGHVRDLPKGGINIDVENNFEPTYKVSADKKDVISALKKETKVADTVWLATDDDREGEAISWHLHEALSLEKKDSKRIVFREITKKAILKSIESPRTIDLDLVNAQQARRILDRLVGYELSPVLWKKVKPGLSAGRVQSVTVRLIVEREKEIMAFSPVPYYKISALFDVEGRTLKGELPSKFKTNEEAKQFVEDCVNAVFSIKDLQKKPAQRKPAAPFTTSTLQQEAGRKLGYSVAQTMTLAQRLYESGKITYMRTDSVNLSDFAVESATKEIESAYGNDYVHVRKYSSKDENAQEAHEAVRPTDFSAHTVDGESGEKRLYELIWKRAIASQMSNAQLEKTEAIIDISSRKEDLKAHGEVVTFEGFLKVYIESKDDENDEDTKGMLPPLSVGQNLTLDVLNATERFTKPSARYSEASLVKKLEDLGIGRPSTYAPTISTVQKRGYVEKETRDGKQRPFITISLKDKNVKEESTIENYGAEKNKLFPTDIAMVVNDFLVENFPNVTDFSFTANIEKEFDEIAGGNVKWEEMLQDFYGDFHLKVGKAETIDRADIDTSRVLGKDPKTGKTMLVRLAKFGPVCQIGTPEELEEDEKPQYANIPKGKMMSEITFEDALEYFKLPRAIGDFDGHELIANIGRFGPYIKFDKLFISIPKGEDPMTIDLERSIELVKIKLEAEANKYITTWDENPDIQVLNGRYGPYIKAGKKNVKIPKDLVPEELTLEQCIELAEKAPEKKGRKTAAKKAPAKKKPAAKKTTTKKATTTKKTTAAKKTTTKKTDK